jgi:hypothetical protein
VQPVVGSKELMNKVTLAAPGPEFEFAAGRGQLELSPSVVTNL